MGRYAPLFASLAVVEERILEAQRRGDFDDLPGVGTPLRLDDDPLVPPELRVAHRILRNAGYLPPEIADRREVARLEAMLPTLDRDARSRALTRLALVRTRLGGRRGRAGRRDDRG